MKKRVIYLLLAISMIVTMGLAIQIGVSACGNIIPADSLIPDIPFPSHPELPIYPDFI